MKTYAKNNVNIKDITPENKLDDSFYYLALRVGNAANKSKSPKNLLNFCIVFTIFLYSNKKAYVLILHNNLIIKYIIIVILRN
jgi:hypothetical protein